MRLRSYAASFVADSLPDIVHTALVCPAADILCMNALHRYTHDMFNYPLSCK